MSCQQCEEFQDSNKTSFYRWKNANIEMRGCDVHLREIFDALSNSRNFEKPLTWNCDICGRERLDKDVSVLTYEIKKLRGMFRNIKYCNDVDECLAKAKKLKEKGVNL